MKMKDEKVSEELEDWKSLIDDGERAFVQQYKVFRSQRPGGQPRAASGSDPAHSPGRGWTGKSKAKTGLE